VAEEAAGGGRREVEEDADLSTEVEGEE